MFWDTEQNLEQNKRFLRVLPAARISLFYEHSSSKRIPASQIVGTTRK